MPPSKFEEMAVHEKQPVSKISS